MTWMRRAERERRSRLASYQWMRSYFFACFGAVRKGEGASHVGGSNALSGEAARLPMRAKLHDERLESFWPLDGSSID